MSEFNKFFAVIFSIVLLQGQAVTAHDLNLQKCIGVIAPPVIKSEGEGEGGGGGGSSFDVSRMGQTKPLVVIHKTHTPLLDEFGRDFTQLARDNRLAPVVGRRTELQRLYRILDSQKKPNVILHGETGVGKTAVVELLAQKIAANDPSVPENLRGRRIVALDLALLLAGTQFRGQFEQRLKGILNEMEVGRESLIVFIDEIHSLVGAGSGQGTLDAANILKPGLSRGGLAPVIGATTTDEYLRIEKDKAMDRRFQGVMLGVLSESEMMEALQAHAVDLSNRPGTPKIAPEIIKASLSASSFYTKGSRIDNAIVVLDQSVVVARHAGRSEVALSDIATVVEQDTGMKVGSIGQSEREMLDGLEPFLTSRVKGQEEPIRGLARAVRRARVGLRSVNSPMGSFYFLGPTGVGKTSLAQALAEYLFHNPNALIRFDMSEFMEKHSVAKLTGAPPGYIGHEGAPQLDSVRRRPFSVVLFDEIEKAHPDLKNIFLQIMDNGSITTSTGPVDFRNTVVIFTSNLNSGGRATVGFKTPSVVEVKSDADPMELLRKHFSPEFANRLDAAINFNKLSPEDILQIVLDLELIPAALQLERGLTASLTERAAAQLAKEGWDDRFGARELKTRKLRERIWSPLSDVIIDGKIKDNTHIEIDFDEAGNKFVFEQRNR